VDKARPVSREGLRDGQGESGDRTKKRIIADELGAALRKEEAAADKRRCPREPDFEALYAVIGDKDAQDKIRAANSETRHCSFLESCARACDELPDSAGEEYSGKPCPNNPYDKFADLFAAIDDDAPLFECAHYIGSLVELGLLPGPDLLSPEEFMIATTMRRRQRLEELQAMSLGAVSGMVGGGKSAD
jgi:hypothetical protein